MQYEPTPEQIEAAAVALYNSRRARLGLSPMDRLPWNEIAHTDRESARAALVAAAGAAPVQVDEAKLAKLIAEASMDYNLSDRSGESHACGAPDYRSVYIARAVAEWLRGGAQ